MPQLRSARPGTKTLLPEPTQGLAGEESWAWDPRRVHLVDASDIPSFGDAQLLGARTSLVPSVGCALLLHGGLPPAFRLPPRGSRQQNPLHYLLELQPPRASLPCWTDRQLS